MTTTDPGERTRFEERLLPVLVAALEEGPSPRRASSERPPRLRRRWAATIAVVAGAIALALVVPMLLPASRTDSAAAAMLRQVARRAAEQPATPAPRADQFLYTKTESVQVFMYVVGDGTTFVFRQTLAREFWIAPDGSGRILETTGPAEFVAPQDEAAWVAAGSPDLFENQTTDDRFAPGELSYQDYSHLPTDPMELKKLIERREIVGGPDGDWETFSIVGDLLREAHTAPAVRAALYEVAADLPGVELVGRVQDGAGRAGIAVAYTSDHGSGATRQEFIFDPQSAELLGERYVLVDDSRIDVQSGGGGAIYGGVGAAGTVGYEATFVAQGVVDAVDETP